MKHTLELERKERVVTFLNRKEVDCLDKIGKDALFSTGSKLSRARLIAWLVDFIKSLKMGGQGIRTEQDLESRIKQLLENNLPREINPASHGTHHNHREV